MNKEIEEENLLKIKSQISYCIRNILRKQSFWGGGDMEEKEEDVLKIVSIFLEHQELSLEIADEIQRQLIEHKNKLLDVEWSLIFSEAMQKSESVEQICILLLFIQWVYDVKKERGEEKIKIDPVALKTISERYLCKKRYENEILFVFNSFYFEKQKFEAFYGDFSTWNHAKLLDLDFENSFLNRTGFRNAGMENCKWEQTEANDVDFKKASLKDVVFRGSSLKNADFRDADLNTVKFISTKLTGIQLQGASLKRCEIDEESYSSLDETDKDARKILEPYLEKSKKKLQGKIRERKEIGAAVSNTEIEYISLSESSERDRMYSLEELLQKAWKIPFREYENLPGGNVQKYDSGNMIRNVRRNISVDRRRLELLTRMEQKDTIEAAGVLMDLAADYILLKELATAADVSKAAVEIYEKKMNQKDPRLMQIYENMAGILFMNSDYENAIEYAEKWIKRQNHQKNSLHLSEMYRRIGILYENKGISKKNLEDYKRAADFYSEAQRRNNREKFFPEQAHLYFMMAKYYCEVEKNNKIAHDYLIKSMDLYEKCPEYKEMLIYIGLDQKVFSEELKNRNLSEIDFRNFNQYSIKELNLRGAKLHRANFSGMDIANMILEDAELCRANLQNINLTRANLRRANLFKSNISGAQLISGDLQDANLEKVYAVGVNMNNAKLSGACLRDANLIEGNLSNADLSKANLRGANLNRTKLNRANLRNCDLREADLSKADLSGAELDDVRLSFGHTRQNHKTFPIYSLGYAYFKTIILDEERLPRNRFFRKIEQNDYLA